MKQFIISLCFLCSYSAHAAKKPNIVFFFADDQTSSSLACYGHPLAKTPHIDKLAAKGTRFSNSYVSQAICWVSRTTILTGLTGRSYGTPGRHDAAAGAASAAVSVSRRGRRKRQFGDDGQMIRGHCLVARCGK